MDNPFERDQLPPMSFLKGVKCVAEHCSQPAGKGRSGQPGSFLVGRHGAKQAVRGAGENFGPESCAIVQRATDMGSWFRTADVGNRVEGFVEIDGRLWKVVPKATRDGKRVYHVSLFRAQARKLLAARTRRRRRWRASGHPWATRIVIAHRLSTIQEADRIYVMQDGRIVQQGRFEELLKAEGAFRDLGSIPTKVREATFHRADP